MPFDASHAHGNSILKCHKMASAFDFNGSPIILIGMKKMRCILFLLLLSMACIPANGLERLQKRSLGDYGRFAPLTFACELMSLDESSTSGNRLLTTPSLETSHGKITIRTAFFPSCGIVQIRPSKYAMAFHSRRKDFPIPLRR